MSFNPQIVITIAGIIFGISIMAYLIILFNNYISLKNLVNKSKANIDVLLKQRFDELPNLINTIKGYMKHESQVLSKITEERAQISNSNIDSKADNQISNTLKSIFAVAEDYPQLKANKSFLLLQKRISSLETEIAERRIFYNQTATNFNIWVESFPNNLLASILKTRKLEMYDVEDIKVKF